ncbi:MAG: VapC toxin family PIN domain ribonuclease, partial [Actinobacteria bacterium]|nr:VapC toxin family PIN domain ribonuclease [Actinomycetota bacterium]
MKLYADEEDSSAVRVLTVVVVSCLARVEVPAAIWRKHRIGEL